MLSLAAVPPPPQSADPNLLRSAEPLRERDPARAVLFQGRGIQLVNDGKCEAAVEQFRRAAAFDPGNANIYINLAYCLDKLGRYDQAIHVWSRAFFFDRHHGRARAYIERARSALAERQRESEELLQQGVAAFDRGDADEARRLLTAALDRGAPPDEALAVLSRLDRLDVGARPAEPLPLGPNAVRARPAGCV